MIGITIGGSLYFSTLPVVVLLFLTFANLLGFGFMAGGLVLVFKQTGQIAVIVRLALMAMAIAASPEVYNWAWPAQLVAHLLPITDAAICLKLVLIEGAGYTIFTQESFGFLLINVFVWTAIGLTVFKWMENISRDKGTLGTY
jgi:ABC-2 type transport system permease protein